VRTYAIVGPSEGFNLSGKVEPFTQNFMEIRFYRELKIPAEPGVYFFIKKGPPSLGLRRDKKILYVGKATSLRTRTRSYFDARLFLTRGPMIEKMVADADALEWQTTDSVLEAIILEANLIKKYQPEANAIQKDDKSFLYVTITKGDFPAIITERGHGVYGPFTSPASLREALRIIRRIFPYNTHTPEKLESLRGRNRPKQSRNGEAWIASDYLAMTGQRGCFEYQLGLCPGTCVGAVSKEEYAKTIRKIKLLFDGKKGRLLGVLKREMAASSKRQEYEQADTLKRQIASLEHIRDTALIKDENISTTPYALCPVPYRIEAYDVAHHGGENTVGVMTALLNGEPKKSAYRKFKIKSTVAGTINDIAHLEEVLRRRLGHFEWPLPQLIVVDGGEPQRRAAERVLAERGFNIDVAAVVKDERHKPKAVIAKKSVIRAHSTAILLANSEAHRFAVNFHRRQSRRKLITKSTKH